jgi:hypothetical protein
MYYEQIKNLKPTAFTRLTGVKRETFEAMLQALQDQIRDFGRPTKLPLCDQLLLTLMYWREYRTLFHIGSTYGLSEATASRTVRKVENALMRSGQFTLPGKKALRPSETTWHVVVVDATECPIEQPAGKGAQKNAKSSSAERRNITRSRLR